MMSLIFTGMADKRELLLHLSQLFAASGKRTLLVDATERQTYRYAIGKIDKNMPVVEFCGFDIADGFFSDDSLRSYLIRAGTPIESYDFVIYDLEKLSFSSDEAWLETKWIIWVSSFERYEIERSKEWFRMLFAMYPSLEGMTVSKVFINQVECRINPSYIQSLVEGLPIVWEEESFEIPWDENAYALRIENEHYRTLQPKRLSRHYKKALLSLSERVCGWNTSEARRAMRHAERRRA